MNLAIVLIVIIPLVLASTLYVSDYREWRQNKDHWRRTGFWYGESVFNFFAAFSVSAIVGLLIVVLGSFVLPSHDQVQSRANLNILVDGSTTKSVYFLASGGSSSHPNFTFYQEENGTYTLKTADASDSQVRYTTGTPYVEMYEHCPPTWLGGVCGHDRYTFYVPEGSIKNMVVLDAKP